MKRIKNTPEGIKFASAYTGSNVLIELDNLHVKETELIGIETNTNDGTKSFGIALKVMNYCNEVLLDTSKYQPCIYACIKHGLCIQVSFKPSIHSHSGITYEYNLSNSLDCVHFFNKCMQSDTENITIIGEFDGVEDVKHV